jgi:hypothetical protein
MAKRMPGVANSKISFKIKDFSKEAGAATTVDVKKMDNRREGMEAGCQII